MSRVPLAKLKPAPWNPRTISDPRFKNLCASIEADPGLLELRPILATKDGTIYGGNMRYRAVQRLGWTDAPAELSDIPEQLAKERALRDNGAWGEWKDDDLGSLLAELKESGSDLDLLGFDSAELDRLIGSVSEDGSSETPDARPTLSDRFLIPPFSVLDARQGYWQERKRRWLSLGIESELGRGDGVTCAPSDAMTEPSLNLYRNMNDGKGRKLANGKGPARKFGQDLMRGEHTVGDNG